MFYDSEITEFVHTFGWNNRILLLLHRRRESGTSEIPEIVFLFGNWSGEVGTSKAPKIIIVLFDWTGDLGTSKISKVVLFLGLIFFFWGSRFGSELIRSTDALFGRRRKRCTSKVSEIIIFFLGLIGRVVSFNRCRGLGTSKVPEKIYLRFWWSRSSKSCISRRCSNFGRSKDSEIVFFGLCVFHALFDRNRNHGVPKVSEIIVVRLRLVVHLVVIGGSC
mmetsp:Transcript_30424/g.65280  ORF Transcript_30424/g.65280 Transcript_30424/m.65280 type:complete len:220 (-) Transcript_30424:666-1325(-)